MSADALLAALADDVVAGRAASMQDYLKVGLDHLGVPSWSPAGSCRGRTGPPA